MGLTLLVALSGLALNAQENKKAAEARKDLKEAKMDSVEDFKKFKKESQSKIVENQKKIAELKVKKSTDSKDVNDKYDKKVAVLEKKNAELKNRIETYTLTQSSKWKSFKIEFSKEMDDLGHSIQDLSGFKK